MRRPREEIFLLLPLSSFFFPPVNFFFLPLFLFEWLLRWHKFLRNELRRLSSPRKLRRLAREGEGIRLKGERRRRKEDARINAYVMVALLAVVEKGLEVAVVVTLDVGILVVVTDYAKIFDMRRWDRDDEERQLQFEGVRVKEGQLFQMRLS